MKKISLVILIAVLLQLSLRPALAMMPTAITPASDESKQQFDTYVKATEDGNRLGNPNQETFTSNTVSNILYYFVTGILGGNVAPNGTKQPALINSVGGYIADMYSHPAASTDIYVADVLNSAGIATPAYAQGLGFASLSPILEAWKTFRNIAYIFFVIIMLVLGFAIMLRRRIGGQAAVTIQQAIPRVVIALLAVTFSYAIAGLLIDLMYIFMFFLISFFGTSDAINFSIFTMGGKIIAAGSDRALNGVNTFIQQQFGDSHGLNLQNLAENILGSLGGLLAAAVVAIALAIGLFRLWFELLKTYLSILINIVAAPLLLMMEAIPGKKVFLTWVQSMFANLAAFPTVLILFIVYDKLTGQLTGSEAAIASGGFVPPYLGGVSASGSIPFFIGLGMILIMPDLVKQSKKALGAKGTLFEQFGGAISDSLKQGWKGGQLVPGLGFTDLSKYGISGKNFASKFGTSGAALGAGLFGGARMAVGPTGLEGIEGVTAGERRGARWGLIKGGFRRGVASGGAAAAPILGEKYLYRDEVAKNKKEKEERDKLKNQITKK